jgi:hypothetical protein
MSILSSVPLDIYEGTRHVGSTDDEKIQMTPGPHRLTVVNNRFAFRSELSLEVKPGEVTAFTVSLPTGSVIVRTIRGAEVLVEGESVGIAPLGQLEIPAGTREIVVRHPEHGARHVTMEIKRDETAEITVALGNVAVEAAPEPGARPAPLSTPATSRAR